MCDPAFTLAKTRSKSALARNASSPAESGVPGKATVNPAAMQEKIIAVATAQTILPGMATDDLENMFIASDPTPTSR
jgi:hypothetical protein